MHLPTDNHPPHTIPEVLARYETSDETALICGSEVLSYKELLFDARHVARVLMERGIKKGDRVALDMRRSTDYIRVCLGIILAGGVKVTLHKGWHQQLRERVLADCAPAMVVDDAAARALCAAELSPQAADRPFPKIEEGDPFRIVYTSGSTGEPKGVVNCHLLPAGNLTVREGSVGRSPMLLSFVENCSRLLMDVNLAFSVSDAQLFTALLNGKTLVLATDEEADHPASLAACIRRNDADAIYSVFSRCHYYLEDPDFAAAFFGMKLIILTGERARQREMDAVRESSDALLYANYGSSETLTALACRYREKGIILYDTTTNGGPVCVLRPDSLDNALPGEEGEICVGGPAGKYGYYWNNPELTAKKYVDHPIYGRVFRTGDAARREADGRLQILGRMDGMTKLHGLRIELGAIDSAMEAFPGIRMAAVKIQGEGPSAVLCGYYSPVTAPVKEQRCLGQEGYLQKDSTGKGADLNCEELPQEAGCSSAVDQGALRRYLAKSLPYYMVPALLQEIPELPLNANGKLDRRALPPIQVPSSEYVSPKTEEEKLLCEVFAQALRKDSPVGIDDSFFALGGDSIRGMAAASLLRERGYEMEMEWLFAAPTPRTLAAMLMPLEQEEDAEADSYAKTDAGTGTETGASAGEMKKTDESLSLASLSVSERESVDAAVGWENVEAVYPVLFHAKEYLSRSSLWMVPLVRVVGRCISGEEIHKRLDELQQAHTALRSVFVGAGTARPLQVVSQKARLSFFQTDLRGLADDQGQSLSAGQEAYLRTLITLQREAKYEASREVPFRLGVIRVAEETTVIFCFYSHLLLDGIGISQVFRELLDGKPVKSDREIFHRQISRLCAADRTEALAYWRKQTCGADRFTQLPAGDGPAAFVHDVAASAPQLLQDALVFCSGRKVTLSALVHLAAGQTLMDLLDLKQVCFASTTSGRDASSAHLVGMFINHFPMLVRRGDTPEAVQEKLIAGIRFGYMGTEDLPPHLGLPGMARAFKLNVVSGGDGYGENEFPCLMRSDLRFAMKEAAAGAPPAGIDGELTLMVFLDQQIRLDFYYSPASIDRAFVKRFAGALLTRLRLMMF